MFKPGDHVFADFGDGEGPVLAHIVHEPHHTKDPGKYGVQAPNGVIHELGHREPEDRDQHGSGRTFWRIP